MTKRRMKGRSHISISTHSIFRTGDHAQALAGLGRLRRIKSSGPALCDLTVANCRTFRMSTCILPCLQPQQALDQRSPPDPNGKEVPHRPDQDCDVLVENFWPRVLYTMGFPS